ncbi:MAG: PDZ domain-containing protein [Pirellulales bacterium]|nr:PDZ domain-containing protein [Pirellulales bacterium]
MIGRFPAKGGPITDPAWVMGTDATTEQPVPPESAKSETQGAQRVDLPPEIAAALAKKYPEDIEDLRAIERQIGRVLATAIPATVGLQIGMSAGSGVLVRGDGLILTAGHVAGIPKRDVWVILSDGRRVRGKTLGINRHIDSGLIQITEPGEWPYVPMAKANQIKLGEWVLALGHPGGFRPDRSAPVRLGRIVFFNSQVIRTDCTLVGGDSGGPLFNMQGEVVAIHSRIGTHIRSNFHVPIATYHATWDRLLAGEAWGGPPLAEQPAQIRPFLGIHLDGRQDQPRIIQINPDTPAHLAGIREGDVIRTFDGHPVPSREDLARRLLAKNPGDDVKIEIDRAGETIQVEVKLAARLPSFPGSPRENGDGKLEPPEKDSPKPDKTQPAPPGAKPSQPQNSPDNQEMPEGQETPESPSGPNKPSEEGKPRQRSMPENESQSEPGKESESKSKDDSDAGGGEPTGPKTPPAPSVPPESGARLLGFELDQAAVKCIVARLIPGSPADGAGIRPGDLIVQIQSHAILNASDLDRVLSEQKRNAIKIVILRNGSMRTLLIPLK